jgi:CheY-like chemotaxis protein
MQIPSILLVEDDEVDIETVRRAFREHGVTGRLIHAEDGVAALEILRGTEDTSPLRRPYIILLDLKMPHMNGLAFLQELRQDPVLCRSVVFVLATSADLQDMDLAYEARVAGYILKENIGPDFTKALHFLEAYQSLVILPDALP